MVKEKRFTTDTTISLFLGALRIANGLQELASESARRFGERSRILRSGR